MSRSRKKKKLRKVDCTHHIVLKDRSILTPLLCVQILLFIAFKDCGFLSGVIPQHLPDGRREKLLVC